MSTIGSVGMRATGTGSNTIRPESPESTGTKETLQPGKAGPGVDGRDIQSARSKSVPSVIEVNKISRESVEAAAQKIQSFVASMERNLNIYVDTRSGQSVIRVVDPESAQVIRQIPPEESIRLAQTVDFLASLLVHQRA